MNKINLLFIIIVFLSLTSIAHSYKGVQFGNIYGGEKLKDILVDSSINIPIIDIPIKNIPADDIIDILIENPTPFIFPGDIITIKALNGKYLIGCGIGRICLRCSGEHSACFNGENVTDSSKWIVILLYNGFFAYKNVKSGRYLSRAKCLVNGTDAYLLTNSAVSHSEDFTNWNLKYIQNTNKFGLYNVHHKHYVTACENCGHPCPLPGMIDSITPENDNQQFIITVIKQLKSISI